MRVTSSGAALFHLALSCKRSGKVWIGRFPILTFLLCEHTLPRRAFKVVGIMLELPLANPTFPQMLRLLCAVGKASEQLIFGAPSKVCARCQLFKSVKPLHD